jgi:hypothetical protein
MSQDATEIVPEQEEGAESNTVEKQAFQSPEEAAKAYAFVRSRLFQVNSWHDFAGAGTAQFFLCDAAGEEVDREPVVGDHLKIDIPGPGSRTGDGFDWVQVEAIEETGEDGQRVTAMRVRPATNPKNSREDVAHFFSDGATSNFIVRQEGLSVSAAVAGRNERPNTGAEKLVDKARNAAVATGAISAFSKLQWSSLVKGFFKTIESGQ